MRARLAIFAFALAACEGGGGSSGLDVQLVDPTGENAADELDGTLRIVVRQEDRVLDCGSTECMSEIDDGEFELVFPLASFDQRTWAQAIIEHTAPGTLIGATPAFASFGEGIEPLGHVRIVMAPPSVCRELTLEGAVYAEVAELSPARAHAAFVLRRNLALFAGGDGDGDAGSSIDRYDLLLNEGYSDPNWTGDDEIGPARGIAISEDVSLIVGDASSWSYSRNSSSFDERSLHDGAGSRSALLALEDGAVVIGGAATRDITWLAENASARALGLLAIARTAPAATHLGDGILVVGGHADGEAAIEWIEELGDGTAHDAETLPLGSGGVLLPSPDGTAALYVAFDVAGVPSPATYVIRGCPASCEVTDGPQWGDRARSDVATVVTEAGDLWIVGGSRAGVPSNETDIIYWDRGEPRIGAGPDLVRPRAGASVIEHASGIVLVAGGAGMDGMVGSFELCFPAELDPL
jgi:hypothetical protein